MTIAESLVAASLFLGALAGSLQVWGVSASAALAEEARQALRDRVEVELMASEARLRRFEAASPALVDCSTVAQLLARSLAAYPQPAGLRRQVSATAEGLVQVEVAAEQLAEPMRRRLWSPAALGLCGAVALLPPERP